MAMASSCLARGTNMRLGALQHWPELENMFMTPLATAFFRSASSSTMLADLPPSSCATRLTVSAEALATAMPARVEPVNDIMSMPGCGDIASPTRRAVAIDEVEHARRHAGFVHHFGEQHRVHRRDFGRLQHHGAAGGQRGRHLAGDLVDRPVPRRDHADDADRLVFDGGRALHLSSNSKSLSIFMACVKWAMPIAACAFLDRPSGAPISRLIASTISP